MNNCTQSKCVIKHRFLVMQLTCNQGNMVERYFLPGVIILLALRLSVS